MLKNVFVAGGTGFVGSYIIEKLYMAGYNVKVLSNSNKSGLNKDIEVVNGDILEPDEWEHHLKEIDIFINLVGIIREIPEKNITFERLHIKATENVVNLCKKHEIRRLLHMSAAGATCCSISKYFTTKFKAEEIVVSSGINYTIFRPSMIFGKEDKTINMFANTIYSTFMFPIFGKGDYKLQPVYVKDVAEVFIKSINSENCYKNTFCLGGANTYKYIDVIKNIGKYVNKKLYTPMIPIKIARFITFLLGRFQFYPITKEQFEMLLMGNTCEETRIFNILNITPKDFDDYLKETFGNVSSK